MTDYDIFQKAIDTFGKASQLWMLVEETGELFQAINKYLRGKGTTEHIAEELADVNIMLYQAALIFGVSSEMVRFREAKVKRLEEILNQDKETRDGKNQDKDHAY